MVLYTAGYFGAVSCSDNGADGGVERELEAVQNGVQHHRVGPKRRDVPAGPVQTRAARVGSHEDHRDVAGDRPGAGRKLSGGAHGLALSASSHAHQRLHRQPGRLRPDGDAVLHLGAPGPAAVRGMGAWRFLLRHQHLCTRSALYCGLRYRNPVCFSYNLY